LSISVSIISDDIIRDDEASDEWADAANITKEMSVSSRAESWQGVERRRRALLPARISRGVSTGQLPYTRGRLADTRLPANGKCLTRVYQMGLHDALSIIIIIIWQQHKMYSESLAIHRFA